MKIQIKPIVYFSIEFDNYDQLQLFMKALLKEKIFPINSTIKTFGRVYHSGYVNYNEMTALESIINSI